MFFDVYTHCYSCDGLSVVYFSYYILENWLERERGGRKEKKIRKHTICFYEKLKKIKKKWPGKKKTKDEKNLT